MALAIPTASLDCLFSLPEPGELVPKGGIGESKGWRINLENVAHLSVPMYEYCAT